MKKTILTLALIVSSLTAFAQNDGFEKLSTLKHTTETVVTSEMFNLMANMEIEPDNEDVKNIEKIINSLSEIRLYATEDASSAAVIKTFAEGFIKKKNMVKLMHVKEDGQFFSFHMKKGSTDKKVSDLVMLIDGLDGGDNEVVFAVLSGDIDLKEVGRITEFLDMKGQDQIEKATQK